MNETIKNKLDTKLYIPFIGFGVFKGFGLPYDSDSFILAMNGGKAMPPRLMYEYSRAAMNIEQKKGRTYLEELVKTIYSQEYKIPPIYEWLVQNKPMYVIDTNLDSSLQSVYCDVAHYLILGTARVLGDGNRFIVYRYSIEGGYTIIDQSLLSDEYPILFKPMGSLFPKTSLIVSDADFVDWLTEAMGGFGMPTFLKEYRKAKQYAFLGVDFAKDTFRMVAHELSLNLSGAICQNYKESYTKKEEKFFKNHQIELV